MKIPAVLALLIFGVGILLMVWGFDPSDVVAAGGTLTVEPSGRIGSILLITLGAIVCIVGLVATVRRL